MNFIAFVPLNLFLMRLLIMLFRPGYRAEKSVVFVFNSFIPSSVITNVPSRIVRPDKRGLSHIIPNEIHR